jgi:cyclophilin family peptidyl-prolyl cis-trans isomerase/HEAT repeat protein/thiol-disulfide isomerase/thioredoxin
MRTLARLALLFAVACTTAPPPPPAVPAPPLPEEHGFTVEEEARVLAIEDRREYDRNFIASWVAHPNALHRQRIALALGRIGPHVFVDTNNDGDFDVAGERRAGLEELATLSKDADRRVREMTAFALGEIGDTNAAETLFALTADSDASVAAEAAEALSKLTDDPAFVTGFLARYIALGEGSAPEGVRARAVRYLFRFNNDEASAAAMRALGAASSAIRQEGAYSLARRPYAAAQGQLELLMTDPNVLTRAYATTALGRIGASSSAPLLVTALGDAHPWVRTNAAIAIGRVAEKDRAILRNEDLPRILAATTDPDAGVRASMLDTLGYYAETKESARKRLLEIQRNGSLWERELAAGSIAKHFSPADAAATLGSELTPWSRVRVIENTAAAAHGAEIRKRYATAAEAHVRAAALGSIADDKADAEIEIVRAALSDADVVVRATAIDRYAAATKEPLDARLALLKEAEQRERTNGMNDARLSAIGAIAKFDHPEREPFLRSLLADRDPVVRRTAAELIAGELKKDLPQYAPLAVERTPEQYAEIVRWARTPHTATIHMTRGNIELALLTQDAPMTAWNFAQLAQRGYFNNTSFMRVVPNFVIQGGDPRNDMSGGPGYSIRDEINLQKYTRGAVGMALSGPDTGGSQFFITHSPQPHLDGGYTIFGRVYDGMSGVVDQTERGDRVERIAIDEKPPVGADVVGGVANVSLPLEIGTMTSARLLERVPDYAPRKSSYTPDMAVIEMMKSYVRPEDRVEVYMGTWCPDSLREVPKFLRIVDDLESQFGVKLPATFIAVDRAKQRPAELIAGKDVQKISTFIYYRGDRELGRIIERPQGVFEDDLLAIAAKQ